jgi:hypothetical protein
MAHRPPAGGRFAWIMVLAAAASGRLRPGLKQCSVAAILGIKQPLQLP